MEYLSSYQLTNLALLSLVVAILMFSDFVKVRTSVYISDIRDNVETFACIASVNVILSYFVILINVICFWDVFWIGDSQALLLGSATALIAITLVVGAALPFHVFFLSLGLIFGMVASGNFEHSDSMPGHLLLLKAEVACLMISSISAVILAKWRKGSHRLSGYPAAYSDWPRG